MICSSSATSTQDWAKNSSTNFASVISCILGSPASSDLSETIALLRAVIHPRKALRLPDVKLITGDGRSTIYARGNRKCGNFDATWPRPFYVNKSPRWWEHEIQIWLDARDLESRKL